MTLFHPGIEKCRNLVEGNFVEIVVEVTMIGISHYQQFFVVAMQLLEGILAEITGMGFFSMNDHHCITYLSGAVE